MPAKLPIIPNSSMIDSSYKEMTLVVQETTMMTQEEAKNQNSRNGNQLFNTDPFK